MPYTSRQHLENRIAAAYGYGISGIPLDEFSIGDAVIVLTKKGEPVNSGQIEDISYVTDADGNDRASSCLVNGDRHYADMSVFRVM